MKIMCKELPIACLIAGLLVLGSCTKPGNDNGDMGTDEPYIPMTYSAGIPEGAMVQKSIGPSGGTIASADGKISLSIPAGAVAAPTDLSIQPISNTVPLGAGPAFRLLPDNVAFSKPVTLTFTYDDGMLDGREEEALDIAYQDSMGTWKALNKTIQDTTKHTLTVQTTRLHDYSTTGYFLLRPLQATLMEGESTRILVERVSIPIEGENGEETPLGLAQQYTTAAGFEKWEITGPGSINDDMKVIVDYTVPATITEASVTEISVTLKNMRRPLRLANKKIKLRRKITIVKGDYMAGTYDGQPFTCVGVSVLISGSNIMIQGVTAQGKSVLLLINGSDVGSFPYGNPTQSGKSEIRCNISGDVYETIYTECGPPSVTKYASGGLSLGRFQSGGIIGGDFVATLYDDSNCALKTKQISGSFSARK
jgi:hypothetical protein